MATVWTYTYTSNRLGVTWNNGDKFIVAGPAYTSAYGSTVGYNYTNDPTEKAFYGFVTNDTYPDTVLYPICFKDSYGNPQYYIADSSIKSNVSGTPLTYTITINMNGGTANGVSSMTPTLNTNGWYTFGNNIPTRTGYQFKGLYTAASGGTQIYNSSGVCVGDGTYWSGSGSTAKWIYKGNVTLYAQWTGNTYYVKYNGNGSTSGSMSNSTHTYGTSSKLTANAFTKTGHKFNGWATTETGSKVYDDQATVSNLTSTNKGTYNLYAKWTAKTYTVSFNANGGSVSTASKSVTYGSTYGTLPTPTREGYKFDGWYTTASTGGSKRVSTTSVTITAAETLYARWIGITYYVKYNGNGNTGNSMSNSTHTYGTPSNLTANAFTKTGHSFIGWATTSSGNVAFQDKASVTDLISTDGGTYNLYAKWDISKYKLTINPNGGEWGGSAAAQTFEQNYGTTKTIANPTRIGHNFSSWTLSGAGSLSGTTYTFGAGTGTLTANWGVNKYKLTINPNGGTWGNSTSTQTFEQNYGTTKTIANPTRTDFVFSEWILTGYGSLSGTTYTFGAGTGTLTARWISKKTNIYCYK